MTYIAVSRAMFGDKFMEILLRDHKEFNRQSDASTKSLPLDEAERLLKEDGFMVEKHPLWSPELHLTQIDTCSKEMREKLIAGLKTINIWGIRPNEGIMN